MAYVLGFFAADGDMTVNKRGAHFWNIQITDEKLLISIKNILKSDHKISIRKGKGNEQDLYRLQIGSKETYNDLYNLGMRPNKTKSLVIPNVPNKYFPDFVRGYFDGDGHVWTGAINKERLKSHIVIQTVFTSCSNKFLEIIKEKLELFFIEKGVLRKGKGGYFRLVYSINGSLKLYDFMYNNLGTSKLFLKRKKDVFEKYKRMRV